MDEDKSVFLEGFKYNFRTLNAAFANDDVALVECTLKETGEQVAVVCAVNKLDDGGVGLVPLATMFNGNPYEILNPPE